MPYDLIYFLLEKEKIVYIGRSTVDNFNIRKQHHKTGQKIYDTIEIAYINIISSIKHHATTSSFENYLISKVKPKYNKTSYITAEHLAKSLSKDNLRELTLCDDGFKINKAELINLFKEVDIINAFRFKYDYVGSVKNPISKKFTRKPLRLHGMKANMQMFPDGHILEIAGKNEQGITLYSKGNVFLLGVNLKKRELKSTNQR